VTVLVKDDRLYCANIGDSRAVACYNGTAVPLSEDHKPTNDSEKLRILAAGGHVTHGRVQGTLAVARGFGDFDMKSNDKLPPDQQFVIAVPDVTEKQVTDDLDFVVIACDGIWECWSSVQVIDYVRSKIATGHKPEQVIT